MDQRTILIIIGVIAAILVGGFLIKKPTQLEQPFSVNFNDIGTTSTQAVGKVESTDVTLRYFNPNFAFSFMPPSGFTVASFIDVDGAGRAVTTVLLQTKDPANKQGSNKGLQILISSWDETPEMLTASRIHKDIPQMKVSNVTTRDITNIGRVIEFESDNASFGGKSHEIWFVAHNDLYQISTYVENKTLAEGILSTWNFQ